MFQPHEGSLTLAVGGMDTPEYMGHEQWSRATEVGIEANGYAFGVMLLKLITC